MDIRQKRDMIIIGEGPRDGRPPYYLFTVQMYMATGPCLVFKDDDGSLSLDRTMDVSWV